MEQYDSEIAGGDECYLPGHGSFPGGDKLLFEKGNAGAKRVAFVSIKSERVEQRKESLWVSSFKFNSYIPMNLNEIH